jgi:hypothetical protein
VDAQKIFLGTRRSGAGVLDQCTDINALDAKEQQML